MNHLDAAIEKWIETAKKMGQSIPEPLYYEPEDFTEVQEEEKIPYYDSVSKTWKVATEWGREEGDNLLSFQLQDLKNSIVSRNKSCFTN